MIRPLIPIQRYKKLSIYDREKWIKRCMFPFFRSNARDRPRLFYPTVLWLYHHIYVLCIDIRFTRFLRRAMRTVCMRVDSLLLLLSGGFVCVCVCECFFFSFVHWFALFVSSAVAACCWKISVALAACCFDQQCAVERNWHFFAINFLPFV